MNIKHLMIICLMLIILTVGVVSASEDMNTNDIKNDVELLESEKTDDTLSESLVSWQFFDNVSNSDDYILSVYDSGKVNGNLSIFANNTQVYAKEFTPTAEIMLISAKDLNGSFNGIYFMKAIYKKADGFEYSYNSTVKFTQSIVHFELTPDDFNLSFPNNELDVDRINQTVVQFYCVNNVYEDLASVKIRFNDYYIIHYLNKDDFSTYRNITLANLNISDEGVYKLQISYCIGDDCIFEIGNSTLKVFNTYASDDFIDLSTKNISNINDCICIIHDSSIEGIKGTVTIFANDTEVFNKFITQNGNLSVYWRDLTGNFNGNYTIKVVYNRHNEIEYFKTENIYFNNITNVTNKTIEKRNVITLTLTKIKIKKSAKKLILKATLKIDSKKIKGKKIVFKFNGKTFKSKTNFKGIAKVTIKKSLFKKLKTGKKITYSVSYFKKTVKRTVKVYR